MATAFVESKLLNWSDLIPDPQWMLFRDVLEIALDRGLDFAIGGGLAYSLFSRRWRNTKDMDLYIFPTDRDRFVECVSQAGYTDFYAQKAYDRSWIYRGFREGAIVDLIWQMANHRAQVDEAWLRRGPEIEIRGMRLRFLAVEELIWAKLYVLQRDRCDWPDLLTIIHAQGPALDWAYLLDRIGDDRRVLGGVMNLFAWMCPARAAELPAWIWEPMGLREPELGLDCREDPHRVRLLDTGDWFGPNQPGIGS